MKTGLGSGFWVLGGCLLTLGTTAWIAVPKTQNPEPNPVFRQASCPAPKVSDWSSIRDTLWPRIVHRDGDDAWAHLDTTGLPRGSAAWCNPLQANAEAINAGHDIYGRLCSACHGEAGRGDGPGAGQQNPEPYNFTRPEFAGMREAPGGAVLYAILTRGIEGTGMTGFGTELGGWERLAVMAYLTSLPGPAAISSGRAWSDSLRARRPRQLP